jgi:hypothetical protein
MHKKIRFKQRTQAQQPADMSKPVLRKCIGCGRNNVESTMLDAPGGGKVCRRCYPRLMNEARKRSNYMLPEEHLEKAKVMAGLCHPKSNCRHCYGRGYTGVNIRNEVVICGCISAELMTYRWKKYVRATPELHEAYRWCLLEDQSGMDSSDEIDGNGQPGQAAGEA